MKPANFHTHCNLCDGEGEPEAYVQEAVKRGFGALGFSSHAPLPQPSDWTLNWDTVPLYLETVTNLKRRYKDRIDIYLGMEIDYIPGRMGPATPEFERLNLDYRIGAVHTYEDEKTGNLYGIDGTVEEFEHILYTLFNGDMQAFVRDYFQRVRDMAETQPPDIIAHFDLQKIRNGDSHAYSETASWYRSLVVSTLESISRGGSILEINTGGVVRKKTASFYPSRWILEAAHSLNIPITISADAHTPDGIDAYFAEAKLSAREAGYREVMAMEDGRWRSFPLDG